MGRTGRRALGCFAITTLARLWMTFSRRVGGHPDAAEHLREADAVRPGQAGLPWTRRASRRGAILLLAALALPLAARALASDEYRTKGEFLYDFAKFVEWPRDSNVGSKGELRVCVLGSGEVTSVLSKVMRGKSAGRRDVTVRPVNDLTGASWCSIFFLTKSADMEPEVIANSLGLASILTVGEVSGFASRGLMVNFITQESGVRFEINERVAQRAGLKISSKLLRLAAAVVD